MKRYIIFILVFVLLILSAGCKNQQPDSTGASTDSTETTSSDQTQETGNTVDAVPVVKVQDSKNIVTAANAEYLSDEDVNKSVADYKNDYTPFVSKMENGVLVDGVTEISFEVDYDIKKCTYYRLARVDDNDPWAELQGTSYMYKKTPKTDGRKITVDIGWWHEADGWAKSHPVWSYRIQVKDTAGTFHNYYFRVEYATTDPVGINDTEDFDSFIRYEDLYSAALYCTFEKPEDISVHYYFYASYRRVVSNDVTQEEYDYLNVDAAGFCMKLPVAQCNEMLSILGVTIEDVQISPDWTYYDKTNAYYYWQSGVPAVSDWSVTKVEKGTNGIVAVYWETEDSYFNTATGKWYPNDTTKMVMTMQLQPDGTYRVLSNLPQE